MHDLLCSYYWIFISDSGVRWSDLRLKPMVKAIEKIQMVIPQYFLLWNRIWKLKCTYFFQTTNGVAIVTDLQAMEKILDENMGVMSPIVGKSLIIPDFSLFCNQLRPIYEKCKANNEGNVATYIPQLSRFYIVETTYNGFNRIVSSQI